MKLNVFFDNEGNLLTTFTHSVVLGITKSQTSLDPLMNMCHHINQDILQDTPYRTEVEYLRDLDANVREHTPATLDGYALLLVCPDIRAIIGVMDSVAAVLEDARCDWKECCDLC